jgi:hypothetical protein
MDLSIEITKFSRGYFVGKLMHRTSTIQAKYLYVHVQYSTVQEARQQRRNNLCRPHQYQAQSACVLYVYTYDTYVSCDGCIEIQYGKLGILYTTPVDGRVPKAIHKVVTPDSLPSCMPKMRQPICKHSGSTPRRRQLSITD